MTPREKYKEETGKDPVFYDGISLVTSNDYINWLEEKVSNIKCDIQLQKIEVCDQCYSAGILDPNCICAYGKYKRIELEFEVCGCCDTLIDDGSPAETLFNTEQIKKITKK